MTEEEFQEVEKTFPELDWMGRDDWKAVAQFSDWETWVNEWAWREGFEYDDDRVFYRMLKLRENRVQVRKDCRSYFGKENVPNINDPDEPTWA